MSLTILTAHSESTMTDQSGDMCLGDFAHDDGDADTDWYLIDSIDARFPIPQDVRYDAPLTPSDAGDDEVPGATYPREASDAATDDEADDQAHGELVPRRKPGGYDSRIEQMLYENPELPILITEAGKSQESGGRFIVYTIKTGVRFGLPRLAGIVFANQSFCLGLDCSPAIFRVCVTERRPYETAPDAGHSPHTREAYNGRLCCQSHKCQTRPADYRPTKAHACCFPKPVQAHGASPYRWCMVAIPGSKLKLGKSQGLLIWS